MELKYVGLTKYRQDQKDRKKKYGFNGKLSVEGTNKLMNGLRSKKRKRNSEKERKEERVKQIDK